MKIPLIIIGVLLIGLFLWWKFLYVPRPDYPPLVIDEDDPEMNDARRKAQATIPEFVALYRENPEGAMVKWPFVTSSGTIEHLGAEVLSMENDILKIRLVTPPVTHTGQLERLHTIPLKDISDWVITMPGNKLKGGFTVRLIFKKSREQWGELPAKLKEEEAKYIE